jgi:rubrerythrin
VDSSNLAHFYFSLLIPIGWAGVLYPFARTIFRRWPWHFGTIFVLSLAVICGKEFMDSRPSVNDIVSDILGFFLGTALIHFQLFRRLRVLRRAKEREVEGRTVSLRGTMALVESLENRSARFYEQAENLLPNARAAALCGLLARDARNRAAKVRFVLSNWITARETETLSEVERAFSDEQIFSLAFPFSSTSKDVLNLAIEHERKKYSLLKRLESAFQQEWKLMHMRLLREPLAQEIQKLELCLSELNKSSAS